MSDGHTSGPWMATGGRVYALTPTGAREVAVVTKADPILRRNVTANAALIAAAPALFDALAAIMQNPFITEEMPEAVWIAADEALSDAAGGSTSNDLRENSAIPSEADS